MSVATTVASSGRLVRTTEVSIWRSETVQNHAPIAVSGFYQAIGNDGFAGFIKSTPTFVDGSYVSQEGGTMTLGGATGRVSFSHTGKWKLLKINVSESMLSPSLPISLHARRSPSADGPVRSQNGRAFAS